MNVNAKGRTYTQGKSLDGDFRRLIIDHCLSSGGNPVNGYLPVTYKSIADIYLSRQFEHSCESLEYIL